MTIPRNAKLRHTAQIEALELIRFGELRPPTTEQIQQFRRFIQELMDALRPLSEIDRQISKGKEGV